MTYSRPGISQVSVRPGDGGGNTPGISASSGSTRQANAPYRDQRNPVQAGKNAELKYAGINALLEFANSPQTRQFVADQIDRQAKKEAGTVLDAYPPAATTSSGNEEAIAAYNSLSPRAKSFVMEARATNAVSTYREALQGEFASRPVIFAAGNTPEQQAQRATAIAEAQASARDASGLSGLPSYQLAVNAEKLAQIDGSLKGFAYKTRLGNETDLAQVGLIQGAGAGLSDGWQNLETSGATDVAGDQPLTVGWRATLQGVVDEAGNNLGPKGQARTLAGGLFEAVGRITDPQEKLEFLQRTREQASNPILGVDGKTDVWSIPLGGGMSLKAKLDELIPGAEVEADKGMIGKTYVEALKLQQAGNPQQARDLMLSRVDLLNDPSKIPAFIDQIEKLTTRVTPEMRQRGYNIFERQLGGEDATALYKEMIASDIGTYSPQDVNKMFSLAQQGGENAEYKKKQESFQQVRTQMGDLFDVGFSEYLKYTGLSDGDAYSISNQGTKKIAGAGKAARANFVMETRDKFFQKMDEAEPGKFDPVKAMQDAINETVGEKKEKGPDTSGVISDPKTQYVGWANSSLKALSQVAAADGNQIQSKQIPAAAIAPATLQAWQQANPDKSFDSLTGLQKEQLMVRSIQSYKKFDAAKKQYVNYTQQEAKERVDLMLKEAERQAANGGGSAAARVPDVVPETPEELKDARRPRVQGYGREPIEKTLGLLEKAAQFAKPAGTEKDPFNFNKLFNNGGFGPQAMSYVDGFLNMTLGAAPANAGQLDFGTPEGLEALRSSWSSGQNGLNTAPLPQVAAATPVRYAPVAINSDKHELFVMVGVAEGTRTASGGYTKAYYGHKDMGDGNWNRGTVSGGRGTSASPQMVDQRWMGTLTNVQQRMRGPLIVHGLQPGTAGFNRVMFNLIDLTVQSPAAARDFAGKLIQMKQKGWTVEAIAKARADSFINPETGRLDAPGFGNNYQRLFKDQRSRAGVYDYRRRI